MLLKRRYVNKSHVNTIRFSARIRPDTFSAGNNGATCISKVGKHCYSRYGSSPVI